MRSCPELFDGTGMSASPKILAEKRKALLHPRRLRNCLSLALARLFTRNAELEKENKVIHGENKRLRAQLTLWRSEDEPNSPSAAANHWRRQYGLSQVEKQELTDKLSLANARISELEGENARKDAQIDSLRRKLFEPSSEQAPLEPVDVPGPSPPRSPTCAPSKRQRGGQPGTPRPGPRHHSHLPIGEETKCGLDDLSCEDCGELWEPYTARENEQVEVSVRAHRRRITRTKYHHYCKNKERWRTKTAPGPSLLFPHSKYAISVWVFLLVARYVLQIAVNRACLLLQQSQLFIPRGTVFAGFRRIHKLIKPLLVEIRRYSRANKHHWHIDDTGWKVFVKLDDKSGFGWYLWVFLSGDVCVYIVSPSRAREVPKSHLRNSVGVVTSDRLSANKKLGDNVQNSYCWVHERREFRTLARGYPEIAKQCQFFLELIGSLFHYNAIRLFADDLSEKTAAEEKLKNTLDEILKNTQEQLAKPDLHSELRRVFRGILKDWDGLRLFFDFSEVPPDNNPAERALRGPVVGRKNSYGSHSRWSAEFMADMFTLSETLRLNDINVGQFLTEYLQACADNGGKPPSDAANRLPWHRPPPGCF